MDSPRAGSGCRLTPW